MKMSFREFDQTPGQGWRKLSDEQRWHDAGVLIDRYISYDPRMPAERLLVLNWHAGQMYGFAGETERAKERFAKSFEAPGTASPFNWNAYVRATIAFLDGDRAELEKSRAEIAAGPTIEGVKPNLDIVDSLIKNFGSSYRQAYNSATIKPKS